MRKLFVFLLLLLIAFMAFPFCVLLGPEEAREFFYINLSYSMMISRITEGTCDDEEITLKIFDYVHENVFSLPGVLPKREKHSYDNLISSIGYCDQQSGIFVTLLRSRKIPASLVFLQDTNGSSHCVSEVLIDEKWRIFDVTYGFIFRTKEGEIATFDDIQKQGINSSCAQFKLITPEPQRKEYLALYTNRSSAGEVKSNSMEWRQKKIVELLGGESKKNGIISRLVLVVSDLLGSYYKIFGKPFYNLFQDLYLSRIDFIEGDLNLFYKARALHLASRYKAAREYYNLLIKRFPGSSYVNDCYFFISTSFMDEGDNNKALSNFKNILKIYSPSLKSEEAIAELERAIDMSFGFDETSSRIEKTLKILGKNKIPTTYYKELDDIENSIALYMLGTNKRDLFEKEDISIIYLRYKLKKLSEFSESGIESMIYLQPPNLLMRDSSENFKNYLNKVINSKNKDADGKFNVGEVKTIFKYYLLREIIKDRCVELILYWLADFKNISEYWHEEDTFLRLMDACLKPRIIELVRSEDKLNYSFNKNRWEQVIFYYVGICLLREHDYNEAEMYLQRVKDNNQTYAALLLENLN